MVLSPPIEPSRTTVCVPLIVTAPQIELAERVYTAPIMLKHNIKDLSVLINS